jgi:hypothetical protein
LDFPGGSGEPAFSDGPRFSSLKAQDLLPSQPIRFRLAVFPPINRCKGDADALGQLNLGQRETPSHRPDAGWEVAGDFAAHLSHRPPDASFGFNEKDNAQLVLFSTETGDAWLLDPADRLAARLARDGESEPIHIEETDTTFAIGRKGRYRIDGAAFVYSDQDTGRVATILGYPTEKLSHIA